MSERRRGLGRGLGALIPEGGAGSVTQVRPARPTDVFWPGQGSAPTTTGEGVATAPDQGGADHAVEHTTDRATDRATDGVAPGERAVASPDVESGVGRGGLAPVPGATFAEVPLEQIRPNPRQPRSVFDDDDLAELAHSIAEIGVLQPVVVRQVATEGDVRYELVMGERRWRASREAGLSSVPAIIKETEDDALLRDALLENLHRSQLNPLEEAAAYQQLLDDFACTQEELATRIGRSRPQISNTLRLLRLPPLVARRVAAGVLTAGHARALLTLDDPAAMERLAQRVVAEGLSVRGVEEVVALGVDDARPARAATGGGTHHPQLEDLAARVGDRFDTRARVTMGRRKGRMTIEFASLEDLERILGQMGVDTADR